MRFLIDVDGVVAGMVPHILEVLHPYGAGLNQRIPSFEEINCNLFSKKETVLSPLLLKMALKMLGVQGFARELPLIEGAVESVAKIKAAGHEVFWLTSPWTSSPTWEYDRRHWLRREFGDDHSKVIFAHSKYVCSGDVFIDDRVRNIRQWQKYNPKGRALLYSQPWNAQSKYDKYERFTWNQIDDLLKSISEGGSNEQV